MRRRKLGKGTEVSLSDGLLPYRCPTSKTGRAAQTRASIGRTLPPYLPYLFPVCAHGRTHGRARAHEYLGKVRREVGYSEAQSQSPVPYLPFQVGHRSDTMTPKAKAAANRAAMPCTAAEVDAWRAVFGPEIRVLHATEAGHEVGRQPDHGRTMTGDQWRNYLATGEMP